MTPLLEVEDLRTEFRSGGSVFAAVDGVSFSLAPGETLGIVGESGCGKTVTSLSIMRLVPSPPGRIAGGEIRFDGRNLLDLPEAEMRAVRGERISMIFQEPMTSLNPVLTVGEQIVEAIRLHRAVPAAAGARPRARDAAAGRIPSPETPARRVSAPALRRHAPARDDRHGARLRSRAPDRRRADHGARRHHPGADPRPAARPARSAPARPSC